MIFIQEIMFLSIVNSILREKKHRGRTDYFFMLIQNVCLVFMIKKKFTTSTLIWWWVESKLFLWITYDIWDDLRYTTVLWVILSNKGSKKEMRPNFTKKTVWTKLSLLVARCMHHYDIIRMINYSLIIGLGWETDRHAVALSWKIQKE